ncbi:MAG TPA: SusC/RagA family TonB-linked outer membrane protein [Gemmatimonadaceae bacterium]|nr:SusC/RagA family TonB-linked outer membrane protein [Gemmatimonadaceae bacterium]
MTRATFFPRFIRTASRLAAAGVLALAMQILLTSPAEAQQAGVLAGTVLGAGGQPLPGAQVRVTGTSLGATTDASGRFRIVGVSGDQVAIEVRRIGYRMESRQVRTGDGNLRISLAEQSVALDAVVVTGTAGGQSKRELGNAVSTINAAQIKEIAPVSSVQSLLSGRAPGVIVQSATGNVGAGARIRIRGASSMSLSNEPLIYVDGVRVNNAPSTGFSNQSFSSSSISRINDINPDDIESIEVIKGPAAATLYGTEASNGVIQIITKKGTTGAPRWSLATRLGTNYLRNPEGRWPVNYASVQRPGAAVGVRDTLSIDIIDLENARGTPVFKSGALKELDLSASGGSNIFTYFAGAGLEDSEGIEPTSWVKRYSGRLNMSVVPNAKFDVSMNLGYVNGEIHLPCEAGCGGRTLATVWANPANNVPVNGNPNPRRGFNSGTPEMYDFYENIWQGVNRFTGGIQLNHRPVSWFKHRLAAGSDRSTEDDNWLEPRTEDSLTRVIFGGNGYRAVQSRQVNYYTLDYAASGIFDLRPNIKSTTSFGTQYYRNTSNFQYSEGSVFPTVGLTALSATTINRTTSGDAEQDATLGFFLQEQLGFNDRLFLTAAIRADDNSAFGQNFDRVTYPKYGASWVISEEPFWRFPILNALKLRAAYGESGKQPITYSALQTYASATGPGDVATVTPQFLGNADLGPERSKEIEMGFDLGALNDRVGVEFSWYRKNTIDAILNRQIAPSLGLPNTQPFNAGSIRNSGTELMLRATPLMRDNFEWDVTFGIAKNSSEVEDLGTSEAILALRALSGTPDFVVGGFAIKHQVGYPIGSYFEQDVVSAVLLPSGLADVSKVMCKDGKGGTMICAGADLIYGNADDAPDVFLGRSLPGTEGSFSSTVSLWKRFRIYGLVDFKSDFMKLDGNMRSRCQIFGRCRENFYPLEFDPKTIAGLQSNGQLIDYYINSSAYAKLREVSFSYTLPAINTRFAKFNRAVITLAGRNLATWTDYPGLEPEAFFLGGSRGGNFGQFEQTTTPQLTTWVLGLNLDW